MRTRPPLLEMVATTHAAYGASPERRASSAVQSAKALGADINPESGAT